MMVSIRSCGNRYDNSSDDISAPGTLGAQPEGKKNDREESDSEAPEQVHVSAAEIDEKDIYQIIVIGIAAIVPNNAKADSLMDEISAFVESNTDAEIINEERDIR